MPISKPKPPVVVEPPKKKGGPPKKTWKDTERQVAALFGAKRTPLSGSNSGGTSADVRHEKVYVEVKRRQRFELWKLFTDTEGKAKKEGKVPVVALKQNNEKGFLFLVRPEDLSRILEHLIIEQEISYEPTTRKQAPNSKRR